MEYTFEIQHRRNYFKQHFPPIMIVGPVSALDIQYNTCPVCGYYCLNTRASFDICFMCFWEDDWLEAYEPEKVSGPNRMSLHEGRMEFYEFRNWFMKEPFSPESTPYLIQKLWQEMDEQIEGQNASATDRIKIILEEICSLLQHKGLYKFMDMT